MPKTKKELADFLIPPSSVNDTEKKVFSAQYVKMSGRDYYLRVFMDGSGEYTRYDADSDKWVHLIFPAA